ncbi:MAG: translation initiation factor IF-6 [Candidatus Thorarchaeota archaeon]
MIARLNFEGDPNVGAFGISTDRMVFTSPNMSPKSMDAIERIFNLPLIQSTVATIDAVGLVTAANSSGILVPYTITDEEMQTIREATDLPVEWIDSKITALGNVILCNDKGALCHPQFHDSTRKRMEDVLDVEVVAGKTAGLPIVGATTTATNVGAVTHPLATESEIQQISEILKVHVEVATVNRGSPYTSLGVVANSDGMITGSDTTGVELAHLSQVLGFV